MHRLIQELCKFLDCDTMHRCATCFCKLFLEYGIFLVGAKWRETLVCLNDLTLLPDSKLSGFSAKH